MKPNVTVIPAKQTSGNFISFEELEKKRVAAYCRVSTEQEEQEGSYKTQVAHYTDFINNKDGWRLAGIYADEGITGTNIKKRQEFKRMIDDCHAGLIDMVITKSISRFARNTLDCLKYIRELRELEIPIYFEKENINTMDAKGEVLITIMASLAQQESQSISQNVKMGIKYRQQQGQFQLDTNRFLGYDWNEDHTNIVINEREAEIVKRIYKEFVEGSSLTIIKNGLNKDGLKTARGCNWSTTSVRNILANEKYCGDVLMEKTVTVDLLTHKRIANDGRQEQYYIKDNHEAIIPRKVYDMVQAELNRRMELKKTAGGRQCLYSNKYALSGLLFCGDCGTRYRRILTHYKDKSIAYWKCAARVLNSDNCDNRNLREEDVHQVVVDAINQAFIEKADYIKTLKESFNKLENDPSLNEKLTIDYLYNYIESNSGPLTEYDDMLTRKIVKRIEVHKTHFKVYFHAGIYIKIKR